MNSKQEHFASATAVHVRRFGEDVANRPPFVPSSTSDTSKPRKTPASTAVPVVTPTPRSHSAPPPLKRQMAIPFPTISEEAESGGCGGRGESYEHDPLAEETRAGEWAEEVKRRQGCIKELRERKVRLEMGRSERGGWNGWERVRKGAAGGGSSTYTTPSPRASTPAPAPARTLSSSDLEFISTLHSSVVWRLWHVDLTPTDFANERALATRLHLVLMRHGKRDIPVPPIVALSKGHHHNHLRAGGGGGQAKGKEVQSLDQLVAKSLLRKGRSGKSRRSAREAKMEVSAKREVQRSPLGRSNPVSW